MGNARRKEKKSVSLSGYPACAKQPLPRARELSRGVKRLKSERQRAWDSRAIAAAGKRQCRLRRVSVINSTNIQSAFLECSAPARAAAGVFALSQHARARNASLDGLKARKRIGPRVNEVLTINDGATRNVFLVGDVDFAPGVLSLRQTTTGFGRVMNIFCVTCAHRGARSL